MSDTPNFGFGNFVPGFDFLRNLTQGKTHATNGVAAMPSMSSWVAPTLSVEEIDKRIQELKTVQFWLDQNGRALAATVQALEVQKMTLSTLKGMNVSMSELAKAFQFAPPESAAHVESADANTTTSASAGDIPAPESVAGAESTSSTASVDGTPKRAGFDANGHGQAASDSISADVSSKGVVDPMQWWGALTNQFQNIAATAMQEAARHAKPGVVGVDGLEKTGFTASTEHAQQAEKTLKAATEAASTMTAAMAEQTAKHLSTVQTAAAQAMKGVVPANVPPPKAAAAKKGKRTTAQKVSVGAKTGKVKVVQVKPINARLKVNDKATKANKSTPFKSVAGHQKTAMPAAKSRATSVRKALQPVARN